MQLEQNDTTAIVEYAGELDDAARRNLIEKIKVKFDGVTDVQFQENNELIAGIRIKHRDYLYEDTVKSKLQQLKSQ